MMKRAISTVILMCFLSAVYADTQQDNVPPASASSSSPSTDSDNAPDDNTDVPSNDGSQPAQES